MGLGQNETILLCMKIEILFKCPDKYSARQIKVTAFVGFT